MSTRTSRQSPEAEISDGIALVYKSRYGRGPTKITTRVLPEAVGCLLRDVNTPAQSALVQMGKVDVAQAVHGELQLGMARRWARSSNESPAGPSTRTCPDSTPPQTPPPTSSS